MNVNINASIVKELEYLIELHQEHGAVNTMDSIEELVSFVLASVAEGSRRPGAWERQLLERMGLVADSEEHQYYRAQYGKEETVE
jgi:hypothetical protein